MERKCSSLLCRLKHETSTGNIADDTLKNIWNGEKLRQLRLLHINKKKHLNPACANCGWIKNVIPSDDLTDDREQLKKFTIKPEC